MSDFDRKASLHATLKACFIFIMLFIVSACSEQNSQQMMSYQAVKMESGDECHLCGMLITHFDGPKGEAFRKEQGGKVFKFCSTRDMFSYYLDPENTRNISQVLVHDMSKMPWGKDSIDDSYFIDATSAWFVAGSDKTGAMGETLASFSLQTDAQAFADEFGGTVLAFSEVTQERLW